MKNSPSCNGYCQECHTVHTLQQRPAHAEALKLFALLKKHERLDFELPLDQANPLFSTKELYGKRCGQMFGVLVAEDAQGKCVVLKAFSSQQNGEWVVPEWVAPLVPAKEYLSKARAGGKTITTLTNQIQSGRFTEKELRVLKKERREFSQALMKELHSMYHLYNFQGNEASLEEAFILEKGMPTGTGDCCAPKLLNEAAQKGLKPLGIAEFFVGQDSLNGSKKEGIFYPACEEKCQPILGFLLCGVENQSPQA